MTLKGDGSRHVNLHLDRFGVVGGCARRGTRKVPRPFTFVRTFRLCTQGWITYVQVYTATVDVTFAL